MSPSSETINYLGSPVESWQIDAILFVWLGGFFILKRILLKWIMEFLLFAFGIFSAAKELCSKHYVATGLGFMNMFNMIGIAFSQPFIGYVLDKMWRGDLVNNVRIYPLDAYYKGLAILPIGMFLALLILPFIRET